MGKTAIHVNQEPKLYVDANSKVNMVYVKVYNGTQDEKTIGILIPKDWTFKNLLEPSSSHGTWLADRVAENAPGSENTWTPAGATFPDNTVFYEDATLSDNKKVDPTRLGVYSRQSPSKAMVFYDYSEWNYGSGSVTKIARPDLVCVYSGNVTSRKAPNNNPTYCGGNVVCKSGAIVWDENWAVCSTVKTAGVTMCKSASACAEDNSTNNIKNELRTPGEEMPFLQTGYESALRTELGRPIIAVSPTADSGGDHRKELRGATQ